MTTSFEAPVDVRKLRELLNGLSGIPFVEGAQATAQDLLGQELDLLPPLTVGELGWDKSLIGRIGHVDGNRFIIAHSMDDAGTLHLVLLGSVDGENTTCIRDAHDVVITDEPRVERVDIGEFLSPKQTATWPPRKEKSNKPLVTKRDFMTAPPGTIASGDSCFIEKNEDGKWAQYELEATVVSKDAAELFGTMTVHRFGE